jgi:uncharacterized membrane protein HdeD (DUF308 family)
MHQCWGISGQFTRAGANRAGVPYDEREAPRRSSREASVIILGIVLLVVGFLLAIPILWTLGIILVVVGVILVLLGTAGHAIGGRRHYY